MNEPSREPRPRCRGKKVDGAACGKLASRGHLYCEFHLDQAPRGYRVRLFYRRHRGFIWGVVVIPIALMGITLWCSRPEESREDYMREHYDRGWIIVQADGRRTIELARQEDLVLDSTEIQVTRDGGRLMVSIPRIRRREGDWLLANELHVQAVKPTKGKRQLLYGPRRYPGFNALVDFGAVIELWFEALSDDPTEPIFGIGLRSPPG